MISPFVAAELDYMILLRDYGREGQLAFLNEVKRGAYALEPFSTEDVAPAPSWTSTPPERVRNRRRLQRQAGGATLDARHPHH